MPKQQHSGQSSCEVFGETETARIMCCMLTDIELAVLVEDDVQVDGARPKALPTEIPPDRTLQSSQRQNCGRLHPHQCSRCDTPWHPLLQMAVHKPAVSSLRMLQQKASAACGRLWRASGFRPHLHGFECRQQLVRRQRGARRDGRVQEPWLVRHVRRRRLVQPRPPHNLFA